MKADHVVSHDATQGDMAYALECKHCGAVQRVPQTGWGAGPGIPVSVYLDISSGFLAKHASCKVVPHGP